MLKVSPWKGVVRFGKREKLNPRYVGPFKVLERIEDIAYKLNLPEELRRVHNTFHMSKLKKCHADEPLAVPLDGLHFDDKLQFVEEPVEIVDCEVKRLKRSQIPLVNVRWNSKRGPEFTWEREDQFRKKYPHLFARTAPTSRVIATLAARDSPRSTNSDDNHNSKTGARRTERAARECTYTDFFKCQPLPFKGTKGVASLLQWCERMESVFHISNCAAKNQVKFATCTLHSVAFTWWNTHVQTVGHEAAYGMSWKLLMKMMTDKYCPRNEIRKLEMELWELKVKGTDLASYTQRFQELDLLCGMMFSKEFDKIEKYAEGFPDMIYGSVVASKPKTMHEAIEISTELMDKKIRTFAEHETASKRKFENTSRNTQNQQQQHSNKRNTANTNNANNQRGTELGQKPTCYECGVQGHFRRECPNLKNNNHGNQGGRNNAPARVYAVGRAGTDPDANVVTELLKKEELYAKFSKCEFSWTESKINSQSPDYSSSYLILCYDKEELLYFSPKKDLSWTGLPEFVEDIVTDYSRSSPTVASTSAEGQNKNSTTFEDVASPNTPKPFEGSSQNNIDDKGYWDSGCSRNMTGNISYLYDFEPFNGGYVSFGQGGCKITGKVGEAQILGPELIQETTEEIVQIKKGMQVARDRQKSYADLKRKPMKFQVGDKVMLKVSPWKGVVRFGKRGKLNPRYVGPFKVLERVGDVAYKLDLPEELSRVHNTFHMSNLKKCHADKPLAVPLDGLHFDDKLHFVEEPVEIVDREVKRLKRSRIPLFK
nr:putative reverse transcriptase domain-containing protein [Tanacetum cinerariifolium]